MDRGTSASLCPLLVCHRSDHGSEPDTTDCSCDGGRTVLGSAKNSPGFTAGEPHMLNTLDSLHVLRTLEG